MIIPDSGRGYLSKLYDDSWMADHGFLRSGGSAADTVSGFLAHKHRHGTPSLPPLVHVHPDETVRQAISILREYGVSQVPVVKAEPPLALAEVVGTVAEHDLLVRLVSTPESFDDRVDAVMAPALPMVGTGEAVEVASARLAENNAVLVVDGGHPTGIVTRSDLLDFLSGATGEQRSGRRLRPHGVRNQGHPRRSTAGSYHRGGGASCVFRNDLRPRIRG